MDTDTISLYEGGMANLRALLANIGRNAFRAYGYAGQLRGYRAMVRQLQARQGNAG